MSIVARFFPNGEFSQGVDTSKKRRHRERRHKDCTDKNWRQRRDEYLQWRKDLPSHISDSSKFPDGTFFHSRSGYIYWLEAQSSSSCTLCWEDSGGQLHTTTVLQSIGKVAWEWGLIPLVHQSVESCDKPESRKKLPKMSKPMARNIRNAVYLLEQQPGGKDVLSFLTLTLPSLSAEGLKACCDNWDGIVKRFFDWLRITLKRRHNELQHVYCTEIQLKRLQNRNEYAPHLHVVFRGRNGKKCPWAVTPKECRKGWRRAIAHFVDESFDDSALENLQRIRRSASRYLSKYLSKGVSIDTDGAKESNVQTLHTQWGGMARTLSKALRMATTRLDCSGRFRESLVYFVGHLEELYLRGYFRYFKRGFIPLGKSESDGIEYGIHVAGGCLSTPTYKGGLSDLLSFIELQLASSIH